MTAAHPVPIPRRSSRASPVFSTLSDAAAAAGRSVTAGAPVPIPPGFPQPQHGLAPIGRLVTAAARRRSPAACPPDACAVARAHRRARLPDPSPAVSLLAACAVAAGIPCCTFSEPILPTVLVRTSDGTRSNADVPTSWPSGSSTVAGTSPARPPASRRTPYAGVDPVTAARWLSRWPPPKSVSSRSSDKLPRPRYRRDRINSTPSMMCV